MEKDFANEAVLKVNGTLIFPCDLNKENLLKFTFLLQETFTLFQKENIEFQIRPCFDHKAIEWQVQTFYYDKGFCHDKTYTFYLLPDWSLNLFYEHWEEVNGSITCKKCEKLEEDLGIFYSKTEKFKQEMAYYYMVVGLASNNRFLNSANWKVVFAKSIKEEQVKNSENRLQEYLRFLKKPVNSFRS